MFYHRSKEERGRRSENAVTGRMEHEQISGESGERKTVGGRAANKG